MSIFKSEIAPKGIEFHSADFRISDKYCTILTVVLTAFMVYLAFFK